MALSLRRRVDLIGELEKQAGRFTKRAELHRAAIKEAIEEGERIEGEKYEALKVGKAAYQLPARAVKPSVCLIVKKLLGRR